MVFISSNGLETRRRYSHFIVFKMAELFRRLFIGYIVFWKTSMNRLLFVWVKLTFLKSEVECWIQVSLSVILFSPICRPTNSQAFCLILMHFSVILQSRISSKVSRRFTVYPSYLSIPNAILFHRAHNSISMPNNIPVMLFI